MIEYSGLMALTAVGLLLAFLLYALANRLRGTKEVGEAKPRQSPRPPKAREDLSASPYFLLAVVGLALHAGAFYFYLWGASVRSAGIPGLLVMVMLGFCLVTGVFYSWARGAVSYTSNREPDSAQNTFSSNEAPKLQE